MNKPDEKEKSIILEKALVEFDLIEKALNSNTKEILRAVAKEEITSTLNESLNEEDYDIEDIEDDNSDVAALPIEDSPEETPEFGGEETPEFGGSEEGGSEELGLDDIGVDAVDGDLGLGAEEGSEDYGMDMTGASDEEVITVYKKLSGEDEIEVISPEEVIIKDPVSGSEYNVKLNGGSIMDSGEMDAEGEFGAEIAAEPEAEFEPEAEPEAEATPEFGGEDVGAEPEAEATPEFGGEEAEPEAEEETEYDDDDDLGESIVYEIELAEDEEIVEDIIRPKGHDKELVNTTSPNTGDIDGQSAKEDPDSGDNLEGGFKDDGQNGTGDNHAPHVMEDSKPEGYAKDMVMKEDDVVEEAEVVEETKEVTETEVVEETEEVVAEAEVVEETEEVVAEIEVVEETEAIEEEEVVEGEEAIDEKIASGIGMSIGKHRNQSGPASIGAPDGPGAKVESISKKYNTLLSEAKKLKEENSQFRTSLKGFRKRLMEYAVFNTNLTHVAQLFIEHSTTSTEKQNILGRFDEEVATIEESKKLYKRVVSELEKTPISETVENKIVAEQTSGQSSQLNETTAYVDPQQKRILELIQRTQNRF